jgi:hypothetical protein
VRTLLIKPLDLAVSVAIDDLHDSKPEEFVAHVFHSVSDQVTNADTIMFQNVSRVLRRSTEALFEVVSIAQDGID